MERRRFTPTQRNIISLLGAKAKYEKEWATGELSSAFVWITEALELLLFLEIERMAVADGVEIENGLIETIKEAALDDWKEVEQAAGKTN